MQLAGDPFDWQSKSFISSTAPHWIEESDRIQ